ncbi:hypothetical protein I4U23_012047 [Adineta vaga]|nr:hypothetical protein I4U23_012047 [Adineta vaga]
MPSNQKRTKYMYVGINRYNRADVVAIGNAIIATIQANVNDNYSSRYNHAVQQCDIFIKNGQSSKRTIRDGDLLPQTNVYVILLVYNLHTGRTNGNLYTPEVICVGESDSNDINEYYTIPLHERTSDLNLKDAYVKLTNIMSHKFGYVGPYRRNKFTDK